MKFLITDKKVKLGLAAIAGCAFLLAGCSTSRFGDASGQPAQIVMPGGYGTVTQSDLPPPGGYPQAPGTDGSTQVASLEPPADAADLTAASVAGVWRANIGGMSCQIATPQTKFGQGYRAGPLHCPAAFADVKSWAVSGKQLSFYDSTGNSVATLYSGGQGSFSGQTSSGQAVTLSR